MHSFLTLLVLSLNIPIPLFLYILAVNFTHVLIIYIKRNIFIVGPYIYICHVELYLGEERLEKKDKTEKSAHCI